MVKSIALGLLMAGIAPIALASSTGINNQDWKQILIERQPELSDVSSNLTCAIPQFDDCPTNFGYFSSEKFNIQRGKWQSEIQTILFNDSTGACTVEGLQKHKYMVETSSINPGRLNQQLSYASRSRSYFNSRAKEIFPSLVRLASPKCSFSWQQRLSQRPQNSYALERKKLLTKQSSAVDDLEQFPQLSRSSLIVAFPYNNSTFIPENTKLANPAPQTKRIASSFGWRKRPYSNQLQFHQGIDYGAPLGSPVVAVRNGIVTKVVSGCADFGNLFCGGQLGNWIEVDHGNGRIGTYGHLKQGSIKVKPGMKVWKNQNIAQVGSSGWSTGAHLDFRLKVNGKHEDPAKYVMAIQENRQVNSY